MVITNVDIRSVDPIDHKTRNSLKETVSLAIEMTTKSQEETAKRESERASQEVEGQLERMKIAYQSKAEESRKKLLELKNESQSIMTTGLAVAEAKAETEVPPYYLTPLGPPHPGPLQGVIRQDAGQQRVPQG
jgi:major vault protein